MSENNEYWDGFYQKQDVRLSIPSQFATFVASEYLGRFGSLVDIGCGNGRDSLFFASLGLKVVAVDYSLSAVESAKSRSKDGAIFLHGDISDGNLSKSVKNLLNTEDDLLIYSRFFIHAITDDQEAQLWGIVSNITKAGDVFALEFRTQRDKMLEKVTKDHFRRFVNPLEVIGRSNINGFDCLYFTEGFGYAKYKDDDAHVARMLFKKR